MSKYKFLISASVFNHLGWNLYRNFATVIGEAISNSWDAEATEVKIMYDGEDGELTIFDNGNGMSRDDLQNKFLNVGYAKRIELGARTPNMNRPHIGRKGIGKMALLSCAEEVAIFSKQLNKSEIAKVLIKNKDINRNIKNGEDTSMIILEEPSIEKYSPVKTLIQGEDNWTTISFKNLKPQQKQSIKNLEKIIALYFRFSLIHSDFKIFLNKNEITQKALSDLADNSQFLWIINEWNSDPYIDMIKPWGGEKLLGTDEKIQGFISSVKMPKERSIHGLKTRVGIELFVNGRMRETDITKHFPSARIPEQYLYGQIHINSLDDNDEIDPFTSNRESIIADNEMFNECLEPIKILIDKVINDWVVLRKEFNLESNPEKAQLSKADKAARSLFRASVDEISRETKINLIPKKDFASQCEIASNNMKSYEFCYLIENYLRKIIIENPSFKKSCLKYNNSKTCLIRMEEENRCADAEKRPILEDRLRGLCAVCKGFNFLESFKKAKKKANLPIEIRMDEENILMYIDLQDLIRILNSLNNNNESIKIMNKHKDDYRPLRNSIMHTAAITDDAAEQLKSVYNNMLAAARNIAELNNSKPSK